MPTTTLRVRPIRDVWLTLRRLRGGAVLAGLLVLTPWVLILGAVDLVRRIT
jgi:hypothetical protein